MDELKERNATDDSDARIPSREEIVDLVAKKIYGGKKLNNSHRGDVVEMMVLEALGTEWNHVGLGWHPWDLQRGFGADRVRIQVRQTAAVQLWGDSKSRNLSFKWKPNAPSYFARYNPNEEIEEEGWFCELFVFGIHNESDPILIDQADPSQWRFIVIPTCDLSPRTNGITLSKAEVRWASVPWQDLRQEVEGTLEGLRAQRLEKQSAARELRGKVTWEGDLEQMRLD